MLVAHFVTEGKKGDQPSLNSMPEQFSEITFMFSSTTISPASRFESRSWPLLDPAGKISFKRGITLSGNIRRALGIRCKIPKMFCRISCRRSRSFSSSSKAPKIFLSKTETGNSGSTRCSPRMNWDFSFGFLAGSDSKKRIVDTRMLSKY